MVKIEMKVDNLEAELAHALESHRGMGAAEKSPKSKHEPPITEEV